MAVVSRGNGREQLHRLLPLMAGLTASGLGMAVLIGWHTGSTALVHIHRSFVAMQYTTALCFLLSGAGLAAVAAKRARVALALSAIVGTVATLSLAEYLLHKNIGIDNLGFLLKFSIPNASDVAHMAPNTATCFLLTAAALAIPDVRLPLSSKDDLRRIFASIIIVFGIVALIGQFGDLETAYGRAGKIGMAVHTAVGFLVLGSGILSLAENTGAWAEMWPRWLSGLAAATITFLAISLWQDIDRRDASLIERGLVEQTTLLKGEFRSALESRVFLLDRMADRWRTRGGIPREEWRREARRCIEDQPGIRTVAWVDDHLHARWIESSMRPGDQAGSDSALIFDKKYAAALQQARDGHAVQITLAVEPPLGGRRLLVFSPIRTGASFDGLILGVIDVEDLVTSILPDTFLAMHDIEIRAGNEKIFSNIGRGEIRTSGYSAKDNSRFYGINWEIRIWPKRAPLAADISRVPDIVLIAGVVITFLVALSLNYALIMRDARRIKESESRLSLILDSAGEGIYGLDRNGHTTFVNKTAENLLGYSAVEMAGTSMHSLIHHHHPDGTVYPKEECAIYKMLRNGEAGAVDNEVFWRKDGGALPVEYTSRPIRDEAGRIGGAVVVFRDISERKRIESERERLIEMLSRSNAELDNFAHIASHDLKEPLRAIHNHSKFLLEDYGEKLDENGKNRLHRLAFLTQRMERLIADLLYFSRLGREKLSVRSTNLNDIIDDLKDTLRDVLEEQNVVISVPEPLPTIECDSVRVTELFRNLIQNAIKYNESAEKRVEIGHKNTNGTVFYVKDNGIGIEEEFHEDVFRIFKRLHSEKVYGGGTGAGLTFVKKIVEQHGGKVWLESARGEGANFFFTLHEEAIT